MIYLDKSTDQQPVYIPKDEYTGTPGGHTTAILQSKDWEITHNGITRVSPDAGYDGVSGGTITVYVNSDTATTFEHLTAEENGEYVAGDSMAYSAVTVNVPTGSTINNQVKNLVITANTSTTVTYDAGFTGLESVGLTINVPGSIELEELYAQNNGIYYPPLGKAYSMVDINVPQGTTLMDLTVTENGAYAPRQYAVDGFNLVLVDVPQTGSTIHNQDKNVLVTRDVGQGTSYISASTIVTADTGYTGLGQVKVDVAIPAINTITFGTPITTNGQYYIGMYPENQEGQDPQFIIDKPAREVGFVVQVPPASAVTVGLTAESNNTYYFPATYGADGFSAVTTNIDTTPYYEQGFRAGYTSGVTDGMEQQKTLIEPVVLREAGYYNNVNGYGPVIVALGDAQVVTSWGDISSARTISYSSTTAGEGWLLPDFKGKGTTNEYPYYSNNDGVSSILTAVTIFNQQLPLAENLEHFMANYHPGYTASVTILDSTNLKSLNYAFAHSMVGDVTIETTFSGQEWSPEGAHYGCNFNMAFLDNQALYYSPRITGYTVNLNSCFAQCQQLQSLEDVQFYMPTDMVDGLSVDSMCDGCRELRKLPEWDWGGVNYLDDYYQPFKGCTKLCELGGFAGLGRSFTYNESGTGHTLDLSTATNPYDSTKINGSMNNIVTKMDVVDPAITDAKIIVNSTWRNACSDWNLFEYTAAQKNWSLVVV